MKRNVIVLMLSASTIASPVFASNLFHKVIAKQASASNISSNSLKANKDAYTDFSGDWVGSCIIDGEEDTDTLSIRNNASVLTIDSEDFSIGNALSTKSDSTIIEINYEHMSFEWNGNKTAINLQSIFVYKNFSLAKLTSVNASGSIRFIDNQLVINMDIQGENIATCKYSKQ